MQNDDSPNRFDRIVAIMTQLQSKKVVKAQELAARFQVSIRTIYRDIRSLEASGIPIAAEAGVGYSISDGYKLPPVSFTREEASSFLTAEKLMGRFSDKSLGTHFESALFKVKAILKEHEKEWLSSLEQNMLVGGSSKPFADTAPDALNMLMNGIGQKTQVEVTYHAFDSNNPTVRKLEPIGLYHDNNVWYLMAYCHLRSDYRKFRSDRILEIKALQTHFTREHQPLSYYLSQNQDDREKYRVVVRIDTSVLKYIRSNFRHHGLKSENMLGDQTELTFITAERDYFLRWYLMFADCAEIIEPPSFRERLGVLLSEIQKRNFKKP